VLFPDDSLISLVVLTNVRKKLLEVLRVIHDELIDYSFVEVERGKFVWIAFNNDSCHGGKMFRYDDCTLFHYENVLGLHLL